MAGRIVVGIDGSPESAAALDWAIARAALGRQDLDLVHAYSPPVDFSFYGYQSVAGPGTVQWLTDDSRELLKAAEAHVHEVAPTLTCTVKSDMGPAAALLAVVADGADAIVVGRRGLGAAKSALLGSVSNRMTVEAPCPVIVVGDGPLPTTGPIVVGVDGSDFALAALRYAVAEAAVRNTTVRAVTAYRTSTPPVATDPELMRRLRAAQAAKADDILAHAVEHVRTPQNQSVSIEQVSVKGRPADAILGRAEDAQLIVVGPHGKGLVRRVLLGSVTRRVLQDADRPVAVIDVSGSSDS